MKKKIAAALTSLTLASLLLLTAGCGQTSSTGSSQANYVIGVPEPMTGSTADMGTDMYDAMKMAVDKLNQQGGMLGHPIQLVEEDSACDPQTSVNAANKLVSLNVDAIVGQYCSGEALPAEPIYNNAGLPFLLPDANASSLTQQGYNNVFLVNVGGDTQAAKAAQFMVQTLKAKNIVLIDDQSAFAVNLAQLTQSHVSQLGGNVVDIEAVSPTQVDFSSLVSKIQKLNPDAIYWTGYYSQGGLLIKTARQMGLKCNIVVGDGSYDQQLITIAGAQYAEGVYCTTSPSAEYLPNAKDFIQQYQALYHRAPGPYAADAYDAIMLLHHVIDKIQSTDKAKVIQALHQTSDYVGLTGTMQFSSTGDREHGQEIVLVVKNGQFALAEQ